jgi:TolA-binding protein
MASRNAAGWWAAIALASAAPGAAAAQDLEAITREVTSIEGSADALTREDTDLGERRSPTYVEERLIDGQLFYQLQDYIHAAIIFTDLVENFPDHPAYPDAQFLLADSLFRAGDYFGARSQFQVVIQHAGEARFASHVQRALGRLIEIAIHTRDFSGIEDVFAQLSRLPPAEIEATTTYFRAKYLYSRAVPTEEFLRRDPGAVIASGSMGGAASAAGVDAGGRSAARPAVDVARLEEARQAFAAVPETSPYYPQALYFIGVIHTVREQYPQAIEAFARVLRTEATTDEHRVVAELAYLALGRLYYETDQLEQAIEAYQAIPRTSTRFDIALYEIAWVYIRLGDSTRAERALEVLAVAAPESRYIPDGQLLRGNLLLRNGRLDDAYEVFRAVATEFGPVRRELDEMIADHSADPVGYFRELVAQNLESFDVSAFLPPLAQRWAEIEGDMDRAMSVLEDLAEARRMVHDTTNLVARLEAALATPNIVVVFGDLRIQSERNTALRNRLSRTRRDLIAIEARSGRGGGAVDEVRSRRRELERFLDEMPTSDEDFAEMDHEVLGRIRRMERDLSRMETELYGAEAVITATQLYLERHAGEGDAAGEEAVRTELARHRTQVAEYRAQIEALRVEVASARLQVGVGDDRFERHAALRAEYAELVEREHALGGGDERIEALYRRVSAVERSLDAHDGRLEAAARTRATEMARQVEEESVRIEGYRTALAELEAEAEEVVGAVAYTNFRAVQHRFYDLVLRADVGRVDVTWARREEHRSRVEMLTRERSRDIQALDDEFAEIMDEGGDDDEAGGGTR